MPRRLPQFFWASAVCSPRRLSRFAGSSMRYLFPLLLVLSCLLTFLPGCEPKEDLVQTSGSLELQADSVVFDTVFTTIRTVTKRLWVYNRNSGAVKTDVSLQGTAGSTYSLVIN